jgi:hypothetical protein
MNFLTWNIILNFNSLMDAQFRTSGDGVCSGAKMTFSFERDPDFLYRLFVVPSIILVVLAYLTFWIDSSKAPSRVIFSVVLILKAIALMTSTSNYIPMVKQRTWLQDFLIWNLIFTVIPLI